MGKGKIYKSFNTVKEAVETFKELDKEDKVEKDYLLRFDGWRHYVHKILKKKKEEN